MTNLTTLSAEDLANVRHKARVAHQSVCLRQFDARFRAEVAIQAAQTVLNELDAAETPTRDHLREVNAETLRRADITLAPWLIEGAGRRYKSGCRIFAGSTDNWGSRVAWLRLVCRDERSPKWQWEAQITHLRRDLCMPKTPFRSTGNFDGSVVFGPETDQPDLDFERHAATVDAQLVKMGYVLT